MGKAIGGMGVAAVVLEGGGCAVKACPTPAGAITVNEDETFAPHRTC